MKSLSIRRLTPALALCSLALACGGGTPYEMARAADMEAVAPAPEAVAGQVPFNTESYDRIVENDFLSAKQAPLSTFSVDVDTASYSNVRRFLDSGKRPPADAVRIEELVNYFSYDYPNPSADQPFSTTTEVASCPWNPEHQLVHIGIQGRRMDNHELPAKNLVFLLDVSGSMSDENKLPLLKKSLLGMLDHLGSEDRISIVVYAGASGLVLPPTRATERARIRRALVDLEAGGSTNAGEGIELAYDMAQHAFISGGINRVLLATDGDFNVGVTSRGELSRLIEQKRQTGVFLTVLGFGTGNYKDATLEQISAEGNGTFAYIDGPEEARKVLVDEMASTLVTIAKDVKIQVEFNPARVGSYRLIGYENRRMANQDFDNDAEDAGEIGAGHSVTALYEITPPDEPAVGAELRYQTERAVSEAAQSGEYLTVKIRYKEPNGRSSRLLTTAASEFNAAPSANFRFSASVAAFGMLLRDSKYKGQASFDMVSQLAREAMPEDPRGLRAGFVRMTERARVVSGRAPLQPM